MTCFDQFLEPIEIAGQRMDKRWKAYKMDGENPGMRPFVGLGSCNCCDYFLIHENAIILVEETQLSESIQSCMDKYDYLEKTDKKEFALKKMREEIRLKAYGSMLVLCRLTEKCPDARNLFQNKKYHFWLVASSARDGDEKFFDTLRGTVLSMLRGVLSREIVDTFEILSPKNLKVKLSRK